MGEVAFEGFADELGNAGVLAFGSGLEPLLEFGRDGQARLGRPFTGPVSDGLPRPA